MCKIPRIAPDADRRQHMGAAGQEPQRELLAALQAAGKPVTVIGGADVALELDAKRAIAQGSRFAAAL